MNFSMEQKWATSAEEEADAAECLRRSLADSDAGRVRLFSEVAAEWRTKYNLPTHLSDEELLEMPYKEEYRCVTIIITEDEVMHKHPDGSLDFIEIRLLPSLNNYTDPYICSKCGGGFSAPLAFDAQQIDDKVSELRIKALSKLHGHIDTVLDSSQSAPWLHSPCGNMTGLDVSK